MVLGIKLLNRVRCSVRVCDGAVKFFTCEDNSAIGHITRPLVSWVVQCRSEVILGVVHGQRFASS
ncbi:hypothetical protein CGZ80_19810 [Rhodopirellula sp. MGV]|nr:hypothetical protein CGZ80_19810 [Rhodopirellula sp. MGV]